MPQHASKKQWRVTGGSRARAGRDAKEEPKALVANFLTSAVSLAATRCVLLPA
eukprot:COSAG03_NODE_6178_length_1101_cov_29.403194_1_plen_52_part_10